MMNVSFRRRMFLAAATAALLPGPAHADGSRNQPRDEWQITGATLVRPHQPPLKNSVIRVSGQRIASVGRVPQRGVRSVDAAGKVVTAGFIDPLTQIGLVEVDLEPTSKDNESTKHHPVRAAFRAADGYNSASTVVAITRKEGVTSVGVTPSGGLISGTGAWADLWDGPLAAEATALHIRLTPGMSRGTAMLSLREAFDAAKAFKKSPSKYDKNQFRAVEASRADLVALSRALDGQIPVVFHADRASDLVRILAFAKKYKLRLVLASAREGWKVAPQIAAAGVPVIVNPLDSGPMDFSSVAATEENAARLRKAGVTVAFTVGDTHNTRNLRYVAGNAVRRGVSYDDALLAVTTSPARAMGMTDYGEVKAGKVANLVIWSGDPFEPASRAETVVIRGREVPLQSRQTALFERYR